MRVLLLAATVFTMQRRPLAGAWIGGLLIFAKQYLFLSGPSFLRYVLGRRPPPHPADPRTRDPGAGRGDAAVHVVASEFVHEQRHLAADSRAVSHRFTQLSQLGSARGVGPGIVLVGGRRGLRRAPDRVWLPRRTTRRGSAPRSRCIRWRSSPSARRRSATTTTSSSARCAAPLRSAPPGLTAAASRLNHTTKKRRNMAPNPLPPVRSG